MQDYDEMQKWAREVASLARLASRAATMGRALHGMMGDKSSVPLSSDDADALTAAASVMTRVFGNAYAEVTAISGKRSRPA